MWTEQQVADYRELYADRRRLYAGWSARRLMRLHRHAKRSGLFRDPRDMIALRHASVSAQIKEIRDASDLG